VNLFDINVLVNAHRSDAAHHAPCRAFLDDTVAAPGAFGLTQIVLSGFLRVSTHPRIFEVPTPLAAIAMESGSDWVSTDGDFARFPGLTWIDPRSA
jgi:predicted nucleic acid-binding protein